MQHKKGLFAYIQQGIWGVRLEERSRWSAFAFKQLRILLIVSRNFTKNKLQLQAAGLTFYTILSVVPLVALIFAIAKGFGFQAALEQQLLSALRGHEDAVEQIMLFASRMLENTQGGVLAGIGVVLLLWTVLQLLMSIEEAFNDIWQVVKGRSWVRKFTEYFSIMLLAPVLIILSSSITVVAISKLENFIAGYDILQAIGPFFHFLFRAIPYALIWLLFTFIYMVMPNTKVNFGSALIAGIIAGTVFQVVQWGYIHFQIGVSKYNAIYGSFAALPLFMIWVNISWLITLVGAEIAYANQFVAKIENEIDAQKLSTAQKHVIALALCQRIADNFEKGNPPLTAKNLADTLKLPFGVTLSVLEFLEKAKLLTEVEQEGDHDNAFVPARSMAAFHMADVINALDAFGETELPVGKHQKLHAYTLQYDLLKGALTDSGQNLHIREIPVSSETPVSHGGKAAS